MLCDLRWEYLWHYVCPNWFLGSNGRCCLTDGDLNNYYRNEHRDYDVKEADINNPYRMWKLWWWDPYKGRYISKSLPDFAHLSRGESRENHIHAPTTVSGSQSGSRNFQDRNSASDSVSDLGIGSGRHGLRARINEIDWDGLYEPQQDMWDDVTRTSVDDPTSAPRSEMTRARDRRNRSDYSKHSDSDSEGYESASAETERWVEEQSWPRPTTGDPPADELRDPPEPQGDRAQEQEAPPPQAQEPTGSSDTESQKKLRTRSQRQIAHERAKAAAGIGDEMPSSISANSKQKSSMQSIRSYVSRQVETLTEKCGLKSKSADRLPDSPESDEEYLSADERS